MADPRIRGLTGGTVNDRLLAAAIRRAIAIARLKESVGRTMVGSLNETLLPRIFQEIEKALGGVKTRGVQVTSRTRARLTATIAKLTKEAGSEFAALRRTLTKSLRDIGKSEVAFQTAAFHESLPTGITLGFVSPTAAQVGQIVASTPVQGTFLTKALADMGSGLMRQVEAAVNLGLREGETATQIGKRLSGLAGGRGGVFGTTRRHLQTWSRTAVNHVTNATRELAYQANSDLITGVRYVATLDSRTCFAAGTRVRLADGSLLPIEAVRPGDQVEGGSGETRLVLGVLQRWADQWVEIETSDGEKVRATTTHPFWVLQPGGCGWVEADDIQEAIRNLLLPEELREKEIGSLH